MKRTITTFFILLTISGASTLQGCGKKSSPKATCNAETFLPTDGS